MYRIVHPDLDTPPKEIPEHALAGFAKAGWQLAEPEREPFETAPSLPLPPRNASAPVWKTYAVVAGVPYAEAMAATRDELADRFRPSTAAPSTPSTPGKGTDKTNKGADKTKES